MNRKILFVLLLVMPLTVFANGMNAHVSSGYGWASVKNTDNLYLNPYVENSYSLSSNDSSAPFFNVGMGYLWEKPHFAFNLGINGYYMKYNLSGINSPFINVGQFDTLNFKVTNSSYSVFIEPKLIYPRSEKWQPYLLVGLGIAWNRVSNYSESPTNGALSAAPMPVPFGNKTTMNFAYEAGLGLQVLLFKTQSNNKLNLFCDYRFMSLGEMKLATTPLQTTSRGPNLGSLNTQLVSIGLEYQIA